MEEGLNILQSAVLHGSIAVVTELLDAGFDINADGGALHCAVRSNKRNIIPLLISRGSEVNSLSRDTGLTPMHIAAMYGYTRLLLMLKDGGGDITMLDGTLEGRAPIHTAIVYRQDRAVEWFLRNSVPPDIQTRGGQTPLVYSIIQNRLDLVQVCVRHGAEVNLQNTKIHNITPLHCAVRVGDREMVTYLLNSGASVNMFCTDKHWTPVHCAAALGHVDIIDIFWEREIDLSIQTANESGDGPIHLASSRNKLTVLLFLLSKNVSLESTNKLGYTPLHLAAYYGHLPAVKLLVRCGAQVDYYTQDATKNTALHLAASKGYLEIVQYLLQNEADIYVLDAQRKETAMHCAAMGNHVRCLEVMKYHWRTRRANVNPDLHELLLDTAVVHDSEQVVRFLIEEGMDLEYRNRDLLTPLHLSAYHGSLKSATLLLNEGAIIDSCDNEGRTPLHYSIYFKRPELTDLLLSRNANYSLPSNHGINAFHYAAMIGDLVFLQRVVGTHPESIHLAHSLNNDGDLPIHYSTYNGHNSVTYFLVERNTPINIASKTGCTPLINAVCEQHIDAVRYLLERGADVGARIGSMDDQTSLHVAVKTARVDSVSLLLEHGADINAVTTSHGCTPLHLAASRGLMAVIQCLVEHGADLTVIAGEGCTARGIASTRDKMAAAAYLLSCEQLPK